jgi:hypothetical protein
MRIAACAAQRRQTKRSAKAMGRLEYRLTSPADVESLVAVLYARREVVIPAANPGSTRVMALSTAPQWPRHVASCRRAG